MALQMNPQNLQQLVDLPVGMYPQQQEFLANASQNDTNELQRQGLENLFTAQANPLKVRGLDLQNQATEAGLPGIVAQSGITQRKNKIEGLLEDNHINALKNQYGAEALANHVKEGEMVGQLALQGAEYVAANPLGGREQVKNKLSQYGMWDSSWDKLPPGELAMKLSEFGKGIQATNAKMNLALQGLDVKGQTARDVANITAGAGITRENISSGTKKQIAEMNYSADRQLLKALTSKDYAAQAGAYEAKAHAALADGDEELAKLYAQYAQTAKENDFKAKQIAAATPKAGTPNIAATAKLPEAASPIVPTPAPGPGPATSTDPLEGRTATGPKGQKLIRKNGQWVPM